MARFETFSRRLVAMSQQPHLTIQRRGTISLNRAAFVTLGEPVAVGLLFAPDERVLALRAAAPGEANAVRVRVGSPGGNGPFVVSAAAFCAHYSIDTTVSRRWDAYLEDGLLCADLSVGGTPVTSNRASTGQSNGNASSEEHDEGDAGTRPGN